MMSFRSQTDRHLLDALTATASHAAAAILAAAPGQRLKADRSPVTLADEAAEAVILSALTRLLPGVPVISEEAASRGEVPTLAATFVLVDPLDGTREFIAGRNEYTVNIAVVTDGVPVLGIVGAPALGLIWRGAAGHGSERLALAPGAEPGDATARIAIRARPVPADGMVAAVSRSHLDPETHAYLGRLPIAERLACGSAVKFCRLAEGAADIYPRLSRTMEWDVAAGHAVLAAAGGTVTGPDGTPLRYGKAHDGFAVPAFVAWGDPAAAARHPR